MASWFIGEPGLAWLAAGLGLLVMEVLLPGAFLIWFGMAALGTGVLTRSLSFDFALQIASFAALSVVSLAAGIALRRRRTPNAINAPGSGLIGRSALALAFEGAEGRVRLGDSDWQARLDKGETMPAPMSVLRVIDVEGTVLIVRAAKGLPAGIKQA